MGNVVTFDTPFGPIEIDIPNDKSVLGIPREDSALVYQTKPEYVAVWKGDAEPYWGGECYA